MSFGKWCCEGCSRQNGASRKSCRTCGASVGTILNVPSIAELRDLLRAKDYQVKALERAAVAHGVWSDDAKYAAWQSDFAALEARYKDARAKAQAAIDAAEYVPLGDDKIPAGNMWRAVLRALRKNWEFDGAGAIAAGDLADLSARLEADGGTPDYSGTPQPAINSDADLRLYQAADVVIRTLEKPGGVPLWAWGLGAVGLLIAVSRR